MKRSTILTIITLMLIATAFSIAVCHKANQETDRFIKETDKFIQKYERRTNYEAYKKMEAFTQADKQNTMEIAKTETAEEQIKVYVNNLIETYQDAKTVDYE